MARNRELAAAVLAAAVALSVVPGFVLALTLNLPPGARLTGEDVRASDSITLPSGPHAPGGGPYLLAEGEVAREAWEVGPGGLTPFQLISPVQAGLENAGFETLYSCGDRDCGGFDFRLALDLLEAPAMYVDLGDYRYLLAQRGDEIVSIVTSRSAGRGHVHLTRITSREIPEVIEPAPTEVVPAAPETRTGAPTSRIGIRLEQTGHAVLEGLTFQPGSAELGDGPYPVLAELAEWMSADDTRRVVLVGHSDNVGGLNENIRLSERRATTVANTLSREFNVLRSRLSARGIGYLAPIAANDTPEGRRLNRRVEAVVEAP